MEHPFFPTTTTRAEALRWLTIAEKLLSARDLVGSKSFATRARDADPTLTPAVQILAVADTLLAGDRRIGPSNEFQDWYSILRLSPLLSDQDLIANSYRSLALQLNPQKNRFPFSDQAFRVVLDAWSVLSDPHRKSLYDRQISSSFQEQQHPSFAQHSPVSSLHQQNFIFFGGSGPSQFSSHVHQVHGSSKESQNFINFGQSSSLAFGSGSGSGSKAHDPVNRQGHDSFSAYAGVSGSNVNVAAAASGSGVGQGQEHLDHDHNHNHNDNHDYNREKQSVENDAVGKERPVPNDGDGEKVEGLEEEEEEERGDGASDGGGAFWTACPYCYYMYEYPGLYKDCTLRCQTCMRAFQAVVVPSPPPIVDGKEGYFCCWGFLPLGFSVDNWEKSKGSGSAWTPFSPMFTCPQRGSTSYGGNVRRKSSAPRIYIDDDDVFVEVSDSSGSDEDWRRYGGNKKKKRAKNGRGKGNGAGTSYRSAKKADKGKAAVDEGPVAPVEVVNEGPVAPVEVVSQGRVPPVAVVSQGRVPPVEVVSQGLVRPFEVVRQGLVPPVKVVPSNKVVGESSKKTVLPTARKQPGRVAKNFGKLDLNVEFSNEAEEPAQRVQGNGPTRGEDDNIEGIGFFEGLDEFLSSLPILNVVADDKVVKAA